MPGSIRSTTDSRCYRLLLVIVLLATLASPALAYADEAAGGPVETDAAESVTVQPADDPLPADDPSLQPGESTSEHVVEPVEPETPADGSEPETLPSDDSTREDDASSPAGGGDVEGAVETTEIDAAEPETFDLPAEAVQDEGTVTFGPVAIAIDGGSCTPVSPVDTVVAGEYVLFRCVADTDAAWQLRVVDLTAGWLWAVQFGESAGITHPSYQDVASWQTGDLGETVTRHGWSSAAGVTFEQLITSENSGPGRAIHILLAPTSTADSGRPALLRVSALDAPAVASLDPATVEVGDGLFSLAMVVDGGGSAQCVQLSAGDIVTSANPYVMFKCWWPGEKWRLRIESLSSQWEWAAVVGHEAPSNIETSPPSVSTINGWDQNTPPDKRERFRQNVPSCPFQTETKENSTPSHIENSYYIFLRPTTSIPAAARGQVVIRQLPESANKTCGPTIPAGTRTAALGGYKENMGATLDCQPASPPPVSNPPAATGAFRFMCTPNSVTGAVLHIDALASGWQFAIYVLHDSGWNRVAGPQANWGHNSTHPGGNGQAWLVDLIPTASISDGAQGYMWIRVTSNSQGANPANSTVTAVKGQVPAPSVGAADFEFECAPSEVAVAVDAPVTVTCSWTAKASLGDRQVTLTSIMVPAPSGWAIASSAQGSSVAGSVLTITPNATVGYPTPGYSFFFTLTPACGASTTAQSIALTSTFIHNATSGAGPTETITARRLTGSVDVELLASTDVDWTTEYRFDQYTLTGGQIAYRVVSSQCGGWSVEVQWGAFTYSGPNSGTDIPAANFVIAGVGAPTAIAGSTDGLIWPASGPLAAPATVLTAPAGSGVGTFEQALGVEITVPAHARAGDYTCEITISAVSAP